MRYGGVIIALFVAGPDTGRIDLALDRAARQSCQSISSRPWMSVVNRPRTQVTIMWRARNSASAWPGAKIQVSNDGGTDPVWQRAGGELYFRDRDKMMSVTDSTGPNFSAGRPQARRRRLGVLGTGLERAQARRHRARSQDAGAARVPPEVPRAGRVGALGRACRSCLVVYEVFRQERKGQPFQHAGSVNAPNQEFAEVFAREQYGRRGESQALWVVPRDAIVEVEEFVDELNRNYHRVDGYSLKDKLRRARERAGAALVARDR